MIVIESHGDFHNMDKFLKKMSEGDIFRHLENQARRGVDALASATPVESGLTASSWTYEVTKGRGGYGISWLNTNINNGVNVAIILQYGHGTGTGGYVAGRDYINPAIKPIFEEIANTVWREVQNA